MTIIDWYLETFQWSNAELVLVQLDVILTLSVNASMFQVHNCHSNAYIVPTKYVLKCVIIFKYILLYKRLQKPHCLVEIHM